MLEPVRVMDLASPFRSIGAIFRARVLLGGDVLFPASESSRLRRVVYWMRGQVRLVLGCAWRSKRRSQLEQGRLMDGEAGSVTESCRDDDGMSPRVPA